MSRLFSLDPAALGLGDQRTNNHKAKSPEFWHLPVKVLERDVYKLVRFFLCFQFTEPGLSRRFRFSWRGPIHLTDS